MNPIVILLIILILAGLGVGGYFLFVKKPLDCSNVNGTASNVMTYVLSNNACVSSMCMAGYGIDADGTPDSKGMCFKYTPDCSKQDGKSANVMTYVLSNNACVASTCMAGYGIDATGKPSPEGICFSYVPSTPIAPPVDPQVQQESIVGYTLVGKGIPVRISISQSAAGELLDVGDPSKVESFDDPVYEKWVRKAHRKIRNSPDPGVRSATSFAVWRDGGYRTYGGIIPSMSELDAGDGMARTFSMLS